MNTKDDGYQGAAVAHDDQIGKVFLVRHHGLRECLVCGELFTQQTAPDHAGVNCYPLVGDLSDGTMPRRKECHSLSVLFATETDASSARSPRATAAAHLMSCATSKIKLRVVPATSFTRPATEAAGSFPPTRAIPAW